MPVYGIYVKVPTACERSPYREVADGGGGCSSPVGIRWAECQEGAAPANGKYSQATWDSYWRITVRTSTGMLALAGVLLVGGVTQPQVRSSDLLPWVAMAFLFAGALVQMGRGLAEYRRFRRLAAADRRAFARGTFSVMRDGD